MLKYIHILGLAGLLIFSASFPLKAQQIIRQTLSSAGGSKMITPFRSSFTFGSCPGCSTLHPNTPATAGYVRQGFQQPPTSAQSQACASANIKAAFIVSQEPVTTCGAKFDLEYVGATVQGVTLAWDFGAGAVPRTSSAANPVGITYATSGSKVVALTVTKGACTVTASHLISILPSQVGFVGTTAVSNVKCYGDKSGAILLSPSGGTGNIAYKWSNGNTTKDLAGLAAGKYDFTMSDANGCQFAGSVSLTQPDTALSYNAAVTVNCVNSKSGSIKISPTGGTSPYGILWAGGSKSFSLDLLTVDSAYRFSISDALGCKVDSSITIHSPCRITPGSHAYDTFSPNGDGLNETFVVFNIQDYPNNELFIFNRWGELVYNKKGYNNEWHGQTNTGADLPSAAYYYTIKLNDPKQQVWIGSITLIR